jgi:multidrug resistance efflux pump
VTGRGRAGRCGVARRGRAARGARRARFVEWGWLALAGFACEPAAAENGEPAAAHPDAAGDAPSRLILTGEIDAADGYTLAVPRVPQWNVTLRWLEKDGARVEAGQKLAELDDSVFTLELTQKKIAVAQARAERLHQKNESDIAALDKRFAVEEARVLLEKARLDAGVDRDSYPLRIYQEKQLALRRAEFALEKALDDQRAHQKGSLLEGEVLSIALEKREREIDAAEAAIAALSLAAPVAGIVIAEMHPWWQRKVQSGDNVWVNLPLLRIPDLSTLRVRARLSDVDDARVESGMRVATYLDAYPDLMFPGSVTEVGPIAREMSSESLRRSFSVLVELDRVDPALMLPGMSVRVEVLHAAATPRGDADVKGGAPSGAGGGS